MGGVIDNIASSAKGMFTDGAGEKAILYIFLTNLDELNKLNKEEMKKFLNDEGMTLNALQNSLLSSTKSRISLDSLKNDTKSLFNKGRLGSDSDIGEIYNLETTRYRASFVKFKVQYNPATIRLYSVHGKLQSRKGEEGIDKLSVYNFTGKSKLSFDLVFDDCDNMNAFALNEVANINLTGALNKGYNTFTHDGTNFSVRKRMDAIMSLLSTSATQQVVFFWANMCFRGTITDVGNKFTMFNPQGNPIRGEMHIELTQDKANEDLSYDESYWQTAFGKCFKPKEGLLGAAGGQSLTNKLTNNNLINLSL